MKLEDYFERFGIHPRDVPIALIALKGTLWTTWFATFVVCYKFRPIQALVKHQRVKNFLLGIEKKNPERYNYWKDAYSSMSERVASNQYFQRFSNGLGLQPKIVTFAFVEALFIYKGTLPITIPTQFWLIVSILRRQNRKKDTSIEDIIEGSYGVYQNIDELNKVHISEPSSDESASN